MPVHCCVLGCPSIQGSSCYRFFRLPLNLIRRRQWVRKIAIKNWQPTKCTHICGWHFVHGQPSDNPVVEDYTPSLYMKGQTEMTDTSERSVRVLKRTASAAKVFKSLCGSLFVVTDTFRNLLKLVVLFDRHTSLDLILVHSVFTSRCAAIIICLVLSMSLQGNIGNIFSTWMPINSVCLDNVS